MEMQIIVITENFSLIFGICLFQSKFEIRKQSISTILLLFYELRKKTCPPVSDTCVPEIITRSSEMNSLNLFSSNDQSRSFIKINFQENSMHKTINFLMTDKSQ